MKKVLLAGVLLIAVIAAAAVIGASKLGPIIKTAVNTYGPQLTKTDLSLGDVSISLLSGTAKLSDFSLGNPRGFSSVEAVRVGSIFIDIDEKSITGDTIVINTIEVVAPAITYEKTRGTDNFQTIANNVSTPSGAAAPEKERPKQGESGPGKKILIKNFILKQGTVTLASALAGGQAITARLPDMHLKNIGGTGASPQQVFGEIFRALQQQITSGSVHDALNQGLKELGKNLDAIGEDVKKQAGDMKDTFKGLLGR